MLTDEDRGRVRDGLADLAEPLVLTVHPGATDHPLAGPLAELAEEIAMVAGAHVTVREGSAAGWPARPALTLSRQGRDNLHYLAVPAGPETPPFLAALLGLAGTADESAAATAPLAEVRTPAELLVFIAATCPHCPQAVHAANRIAVASPRVRVAIVDAERYPELAARYKVRSVPCTVLDGGWTRVGVVTVETLVEQILNRDDPEHEAAAFQSLIDAGRNDEAADRLVSPGGHTAFITSWKKSAMSDRMGLMLVVEETLDSDAHALDGLVAALLPVLGAADAALRGDTADLLGQIGHPDAVAVLRPLLDDENPDVAEIAAEALEAIRKPSGTD